MKGRVGNTVRGYTKILIQSASSDPLLAKLWGECEKQKKGIKAQPGRVG